MSQKPLSSVLQIASDFNRVLTVNYIKDFLANQCVNFLKMDGVYPEDYTGNLHDCVKETYGDGFCYYESQDSVDLVEGSESHYLNYSFNIGALRRDNFELKEVNIKFTRINYSCGGEDFDLLSESVVKKALLQFMNDFETVNMSLVE